MKHNTYVWSLETDGTWTLWRNDTRWTGSADEPKTWQECKSMIDSAICNGDTGELVKDAYEVTR